MKRIALVALLLVVFGVEAVAQRGAAPARIMTMQQQQGRDAARAPAQFARELPTRELQGMMPEMPVLPDAPPILPDFDEDEDEAKLAELREIRFRFGMAYNSMIDYCGGILDRVTTIRTLAGWGAGVSGVGTLAAGGALGTGIARAVVDRRIDEQAGQIEALIAQVEAMEDRDFFNFLLDLSWMAEFDRLNQEHDRLVDQSRRLGHWRTGLAAGATATSIAATALAAQNFNLDDLISQMEGCNRSIELMRVSESEMSATIMDGDFFGPELHAAHRILAGCDPYDINAMRRIETHQRTATVSSAIGIGTGLVATGTSIAANTRNVRADRGWAVVEEAGMVAFDRQNAERNAEMAVMRRGLNLTANIASGATVATSGVATGFNAATLATVSSIIEQAERCERAL